MKKILVVLLPLLLLGFISTTAFAQPEGDPEAAEFREAFLAGDLSWDDVLARAAEEGEVNWFHWGGSETLNSWIDTVVKPDLKELGVELKTSRIPNTRDAVDLVLADAAADRGVGQGSVDAIWINGENFFTLASQDLTLGSYAGLLPNSKYFNFDESDPASGVNLFDFGYPTEQREVPWSGGQYICYIDTARLSRDSAPSTFADLEALLRVDPGRFTYVRPPHFQGNTFVQSVLYAHNPDGTGSAPFQKNASDFSAEELTALVTPGFEYLKRLEPFVLGGGGEDGKRGSPIYPENNGANETLFVNGEVDMQCRFNIYAVATGIENGNLSETTENIIFPEGNMIKNKNFIGIPLNSPNPAAALVLANLLSDPANQISKLGELGYALGVDVPLLSEEDQAAVVDAAKDLHGVTFGELAESTVPDTNASLIDVIETVWIDYIERQSEDSIGDIVAAALSATE